MGVRRGARSEAGPGPRLEPDAAEYFRRALETLQEGLSPEELALFAPNVLAEAAAVGLGAALDPGGSRVLQALLPQAPLGMLGQVLPPLVLGGLGGAAGHPLGARVLEAALGRVLPALGEAVGQAEEAVGQAEEAVGQLAAAVRDDLVAFARHPAGSFVVRALLRVLGGVPGAGEARLLEAAMAVAGPQRLRELFQQQLKGHLQGVASHRVANHGLQRLLDHAPADVVGEVLAELGPALAEPLARGHPGVLTALLGACRRHPSLQQEALRCLLQAFGCWEPRERRRACVGLLAGLRPFGGGDKDAEGVEPEPSLGPVTLHGSLLLQHLLHFGDPGMVLGGLEALPPPALAALARSPPGSRVWDALLASPTVPTRARRRLLRKLKGHFLSLACHRNGSRVLDAIWASASAPARAAIAGELASQHEALRRDPHGRGVARTLSLDLFLRRRRLWERLQAAPDRRRGLLGPLLEN
ncbi:nucleolar protein 9 [Phoenicopterus ruber ruber]